VSLTVVDPPPWATIQDAGRPAVRHAGVPPSGAMDPDALALVNLALGNRSGDAAMEWALGPGTLRTEASITICCSGTHSLVSLGRDPLPPWTTRTLPAGATLTLAPPAPDRFAYLAVRGGLTVPPVLGSRSTYVPAGFGGYQGRLLRRGDEIPTGTPGAPAALPFTIPPVLRTRREEPMHFVRGPEASCLSEEQWSTLVDTPWEVGPESDRTGLRLVGPSLPPTLAADFPSAPVCPGTVQMPPGGAPVVLMPDGPTIGGYPRVAVVISTDLGRLAMTPPGRAVRFAEVGIEEAQRRYRRRRVDWHTLEHLVGTHSGRGSA